MAKLFGTDGVRGIANKYPMTAEFALELALVCGNKICTKHKKVLIAKDTRISGDMLESALCAGFTSSGVDVVLLGVLPTPILTAITSSYDVDMAVMITASHNPYYDNGIKLIDANGDKFADKVTKDIENKIIQKKWKLNNKNLGKIIYDDTAKSRYFDLLAPIVPEKSVLKGLRLVIDCANGAFSDILPDVFMKLGAGVIAIGKEPNGYNINKDCGSQHIKNLQDTIRDTKAHMGIAVDGDGDRIVVCDENGNKVPAEQLIAFVANYLAKLGKIKNKILVSTIVANVGLEKYAKENGWEYHSTPVGERYVIDKMQKIGASVGGEESGHIVVSDFCKTGDGLVAGLLTALGVLESGKKVSEVFSLFALEPLFYENIRFDNKDVLEKVLLEKGVVKAVKTAKKMLEATGRIVLRPSGTEPLLRIWVCGEDANMVEKAGNVIVAEVLRVRQC